MDFFEQQEVARKNTGYLVALFVLAVSALISVTYLVVASAVAYLQGGGNFTFGDLWNWRILVGIGGSIVFVVGGAVLTRMVQLRSGGQVVAEMLGGRRVEPASVEPAERRLLNVVEEMAIASGTPVPPVYILDQELSINAFAAGHTQEDAVIGVTRGALEAFTRDQLQGVVAHEFSHILNGDMRLNIRLMGVLYGILVIGLVGWFILRSPIFAVSRSARDRERGAAILLLKVMGVVLVVIGWLGTFFGNLIKAAVSRQREYLADASAVQFTRNPEGIGGALKRIAEYGLGSRLHAAHAVEMSHMLFGEGVRSLFSTHPPLADRIRRVAPGLLEPGGPQSLGASTGANADGPLGVAGFGALSSTTSRVQPEAAQQVEGPAPEHLIYAQQLLEAMPTSLRDAAHEPYSARALVYCMLLSEQAAVRRLQLEELAARMPVEFQQVVLALRAELESLGRTSWLPLVEMALPSLSEMSEAQFRDLRSTMQALIQADQRVDLFEWVLQKIVLRHLEQHFGFARPGRVRHHSLERLVEPSSVLLSLLAYAGHREEDAVAHAFEAGKFSLGLASLRRLPRKQALGAIEVALERLAGLAPRLKRQLLMACAECISADHQVTAAEAELFRAFASALDCPMPPMLPGQPLTRSPRRGQALASRPRETAAV